MLRTGLSNTEQDQTVRPSQLGCDKVAMSEICQNGSKSFICFSDGGVRDSGAAIPQYDRPPKMPAQREVEVRRRGVSPQNPNTPLRPLPSNAANFHHPPEGLWQDGHQRLPVPFSKMPE